MTEIVKEIHLPGIPLFKTGKVRSVYDLGSELLLVSSDRVSAFDYILPQGLAQKGKVLNKISEFWFKKTRHICQNHFISSQVESFPGSLQAFHSLLKDRSMLVKKTELIEIECVVRGYLAGSAYKEYVSTQRVCGKKLPSGLALAEALPEPLFTPARKARSGHDENISFEEMENQIGVSLANRLKDLSLALYGFASNEVKKCGLLLADTKFEFGLIGQEIFLIDEALTPDSSRYWDIETYKPGTSPPGFDKQLIRDYLESTGWDKQSTPPLLPESLLKEASLKYIQMLSKLEINV